MIRFDAGRQRLWARPEQVATLLLSVSEPGAPALADEQARATLQAFAAAGARVSGVLVREVAELLAVLARPRLLVEVETTIGDVPGPSHTLWLGADLGVMAEGMVGEDRYAYAPVSPSLVPWVLGHLVALRRRPAPFPARPVIVARRLLDAAMAEVESEGPARAVTSLRAKAHLEAETAAAVVNMLESRRLTWRATSLWQDDRPRSTSLTVVDAVDAGYWLSSTPEEADFEDPALDVTLQPVSSGEVWRRLSALLPGEEAVSP